MVKKRLINLKEERIMSNIKKLSTSALVKKLFMSKSQLDELLLVAKYIVKDEKGYRL